MAVTLRRALFFCCCTAIAACRAASSEPPAAIPVAEQEPSLAPSVQLDQEVPRIDDAFGGRLYDRFYDGKAFAPDRSGTPGVADGHGGPFGNGTLPLSDGTPLLNDSGHDYRLKNLFGWDLRGQAGISGPEYHNKSGVLEIDLLDQALGMEEIERLVRDGSDRVPAYGAVLESAQLTALARFIEGVRKGNLPHPDRIWSLSKGTAGNYRLARGANPERGKEIFAQRCARCHGEQGTEFLLDDDEYSLGTHARQKAYEDWLKILNGQPFTSMKRFVKGSTGDELGQEVLDLLAALCDRRAFPQGGASRPDVADGDPRCGDYLR